MTHWSDERNPSVLHELIARLEQENAHLRHRLAELEADNARLRALSVQPQVALSALQEQVAQLQKHAFGPSSERRAGQRPGQAAVEVTEEQSPAVDEPARAPQRGHGPRSQPALERRKVRIELGESERRCTFCGGELLPIAGMSECSERVTVIRRRYVVEQIERQKYGCRCGVGLVTAPAPVTHQSGGRYSLEFAAHVAEQKYLEHLPLDRQRRAMTRLGLDVTTSALWDQLDALALLLEPSYRALREYILGGEVIGVDETWWRVMGKKDKARWWVWTLTAPDAFWYGIAPSRSAATARGFVGDFDGIVVCDGYRAYETLARESDSLRLALCWSHARRKFVDALGHYPQCAVALELIGQLFAIDHVAPEPGLLGGEEKLGAAQARLQARALRAPPILDALRSWALAQRALPSSGLRKATDYLLQHWETLCVFVHEPYVPMDNNRSERALRSVVLGRKNHLGSRSERGTAVAAILYSLLETAVLHGLDPHQYLVAAARHALSSPAARPLLPLA